VKTFLKLLLLCAALAPMTGRAQTYPERSVTIVIPFSPGGSNDTVGRFLADGLSKLWKQNVITENKSGGGSLIGTNYVANSPPDGYRMLFVSGSFTTNAATRTEGFDPKSLRTAGMVATGHIAVVTGPRVPMASLADLAREAKKQTLFFATSGVGSSQHFNGELIKEALGIDMTAVPYRGGSEGLHDMAAGRVDVVVGTLGGLMQYIETGKAKPIAVLSKTRARTLPNVQTTGEAGYPSATIDNYFTVMLPAKTPDAIVTKVHQGIKTVMHSPEGRQFLAKLDSEPSSLSPDEAAAYIAKEIEHWTRLSKKMNLTGK
jgi:tripartite-type tricarboxylate transporter receptor subunit TctC